MRRDDAIARLKTTEPTLRGLGVAALFLFGSHARDEAEVKSDVDVFVDPASDEQFGYRNYVDAYQTIRQCLGNIDLGYSTREGLSPYVRAGIEREAIRIF